MSDLPQKVIVFLDILAKSDYKKFLDLFEDLSCATTKEIWEEYPLIERKFPKLHKYDKTGILETYLLINYCKKNNIDYEIWYYKSLFIFNDDLYMIINDEVQKVDITDTVIMTMRDNWKHPFFKVLQQVLEKNGGRLSRTNEAVLNDVGCMNKFYGISKLYLHRDKYIHDICIPYILHNSEYEVFIDFVQKHMGNTLVLKSDCRQEGKGIIFKQSDNLEQRKEIISFFDAHFYKGKPFFITPAYSLNEEFRIYFVKQKNDFEIYSIKQRSNQKNNDELTFYKNIQIYKNLPVKWKLLEKNSQKFFDATQIVQDLLDNMEYDTGCIEFAFTDDNKVVFFEVNQMAAPLTFDNDDLKDMDRFYEKIYDKMLHI